MDMNDDCHLSLSIAEIEDIDVPAGFQALGDLDAFIDPEPAGYAIIHVQLGDDRELSAGRLAHAPGQACPVRQAPAELVRAPAEPWAEERADQVVVPETEFRRVEAS